MSGTGTDEQALSVQKLLAAGDFILASDTAEKAIEGGNISLQLKHLSVLSLARSGALDQAIRKYDDLQLNKLAQNARPASLKTDIGALWARLLKDKALISAGPERATLLSEAADAYEAVFREGGGSYPAVNAAALRLLAGDGSRAVDLADAALRALPGESNTETYWGAVTAAEAHLVKSDIGAASSDLGRAAKLAGQDFASIAVTRRQLRLICNHLRIDASILDALSAPSVVHYAGCAVGRGSESIAAVQSAIRRFLAGVDAGFGYGGLSSTSEILFAEELLDRGAELHVVLPFNIEEFKDVAVAPLGEDWLARFEACLAGATSVDFATSDAFLGDRSLYDYGIKLAIGFALLRTHFLDTRATQCVVWDAAAGEITSGVSHWRRLGLQSRAIDPQTGTENAIDAVPPIPSLPGAGRRTLKALIFGDFKGFSKLQEHQIEAFTHHVLGALAKIIREHGADVSFKNTWGDGLYLVVNNSTAAARLALALQRAMKALPLSDFGLPPTLGLRLGAHFGPVFSLIEPITEIRNFVGTHVSRTARIEPVTPEGAVYVTDAFAADMAADEAGAEFALAYVGNISAAKGYGNLRMYALGERGIR